MKIFLLLLLFFTPTAYAVEFDIYQSDYKPLNLALLVDIAPEYEDEEALFSHVIGADLDSSQSFHVQDPMSFIASPGEAFEHVAYNDWRIIGTDTLVLCQLRRGQGEWFADVQIHQPFQKKMLAEKKLSADGKDLRALGHEVANLIYQAVLKIPGHFATHIIYVNKQHGQSNLVYMDQDGHNSQVIGKNFTLLLSPDWSPDGRFIALNTYVGNRPRLEFFDLKTGKRDVFGHFKGLNSTPEYSPDGQQVAATLSWTGTSEIHLYDIKTRKWRQFSHGKKGVDTTPTWSPDGKWIAFASNRNGSPQIFRKAITGGEAEQVSLEGDYNTSPVWSPKGDRIAFITKKEWSYALATARMDGSDLRYLATGDAIESPSWSPNGQMILYAAEDHGVRRIYRVPSWGGKAVAVTPAGQDASDPAWSRR